MTRRMHKILIANRGEIALRIIRACRDAGYLSVAIASDADRNAKFARVADEVHALPGNSPTETYLNQKAIIDIAKIADVDAVHPGYGLLSENEDFAAAVEEAGMIWIGPDARAIAALGDKVQARAIAEKVGAPLLPASMDSGLTLDKAEKFIGAHGLPVIIKAKSGGGGRGMRVVRDHSELAPMFESAQREAGLAFGRPECFIERYAQYSRHVETQCLADCYGNVVVLSTRDCTLQRRQQKLIEEAPAPFLSEQQIARLNEASSNILKSVSYRGAATCEFLLTSDDELYFLEVNTRVQVEHPVTEEITGVDIIRAMFRIAEGEVIEETAPIPRGHAIEFRINAEDLWADFQPSPGKISGLSLPGGPGVRLDVGYDIGDNIPPYYDSLFGKLVVWGETRAEAIARARRALSEFAISGPKTIAPLHRAILERDAFTADTKDGFTVHTRWIDEELNSLAEVARNLGTFAPDFTGATTVSTDTAADSDVDDDETHYRLAIKAPLSGLVIEWLVEEGEMVSPGDAIAVMEAMKMEQTVCAEAPGVVSFLNIKAGSFIEAGEDLVGLD